MKVTLINRTMDARDTLIYTKNTRLTQGEATRDKIFNMTEAERQEQLEYMANTIPSSWEFIDYIFEIQGVTRAFTHQFVRTRTGSYAQQTMRMLEMEKFSYMTPDPVEDNPDAAFVYHKCMAVIQQSYDDLLAMGIKAEDARGVLPTNIHTNIIAKFNLRTLSDMAKSRTGGRTQTEYRRVMDAMIEAVLKVHPWAELFLFPKGRAAADELEALLMDAHEYGALTKDGLVAGQKAIDKLKKEG